MVQAAWVSRNGSDDQKTADVGLEVSRTFLNLPIHAGFALPDLKWLFLRQAVTQTMPRSSASVGHCFDEMSHV